jgi:hypothetical protein
VSFDNQPHPIYIEANRRYLHSRVAAVTPKVIEDYKDMMRDTTSELQEHLESLEQRMKTLAAQNATGSAQDNPELQAILEEKESTRHGLKICTELSAQIEQFESKSKEPPMLSQRPSVHKYIKAGFEPTKGSIQALVSRLQSYEEDLNTQMETMRSTIPLSDSNATELARLQETRESISQCINVVSNASDNLTVDRRNIFEDISMADDAYNIQVSTVGALFTARKVNITGRARNVIGQMNDESVQTTMNGLTQLDMSKSNSTPQAKQNTSQTGPTPKSETENEFHPRHGRGIRLAGTS